MKRLNNFTDGSNAYNSKLIGRYIVHAIESDFAKQTRPEFKHLNIQY